MLVLGVCGSSASSKRTKALIEHALSSARLEGNDIQTDIIDLSEVTLDFCDGRPFEDYTESTKKVLDKIKMADAYLFGSPMYRGSMTGALKNLIDLIPNDFIKGKAAGLVATGGSDHHYLGLDLGFRTAMAFFQVHIIPGTLYHSRFTVEGGYIVEEKVREQAERFGRDLVELAAMTNGKVLGPSLY
ncbi:NAD(P)H-dependent oxidoreductase [Paenibacillus sp. BSR1-1]|uniref:NADPH-dependent FMN reductase n=1 Tax=Paenibacillus sp. BSR1-1 TaxID=3020845 RepID=UPI0025AF5E72|nr:NAD(P)H-dependent oxidoreductase [Paenibacillus sp. BSR1-1]MDN3016199.1 NAD(P)H-dependent oxidoreductase [Paenibacillus sp. BSR1-1]